MSPYDETVKTLLLVKKNNYHTFVARKPLWACKNRDQNPTIRYS